MGTSLKTEMLFFLKRRITFFAIFLWLFKQSQIVLNNLNSELEFQFATFESLLAVLARLHGLPLLDHSLLEEEAEYSGEIRITVDRNSFPVPLRLMSYVSGDWHLASDWYSWPLLP